MVFLDPNFHEGRCSSFRHLAWHKCCWVALVWDLVQHLLDWRLPLAVLMALLILLISCDFRVNYEFCCFVCCSDSTLGTNIVSLASSLTTTAGANMTKTANVFTHNIFIEQFIKVLQPDKSL